MRNALSWNTATTSARIAATLIPLSNGCSATWESALRFVFRNFPLRQIHPHAEAAAETAEFAAAKGKFWEMHDLIFENQSRLSLALFEQLAQQLGLSSADLLDALNRKEYEARVSADFSGGVRSGVNGTPTFFINGQRHNGSFEYEDLLAAIESARR